MKKIILDLCGGTGAWSKPYRDAGYEVHNITLPKYDVRNFHLKPTDKIYGILAAPPCTMFSRARTTAKTPRDFEGAMEIVRACLEIIWTARMDGGLKFWAMENPMGMLRQFMGNPAYSFKGWEFGDKHVKFTDLWGYFNKPKRTAKEPLPFNLKKWASPAKPKEYAHLKLSRADVRAITPAGFAKAFYEANK
jgi:hypothetical protein